MTIVLVLALAVCLVGLAMYVFLNNSTWREVGRLMFFAGLLVFLMQAPHTAIFSASVK